MKYVIGFLIVVLLFYGWKFVSRTAYETAEYRLMQSDGEFEIREYPDLLIVSTASADAMQGNDGSFMKLFRYISGDNQSSQKIAMTTPVFMEPKASSERGKMSFVLPSKYSLESVPLPESKALQVERRAGGRYAVIRFAGRLTKETAANAEEKLRQWLAKNNLSAAKSIETAGYDPPVTPGPFRRNEVLIRIESE